MRYEIVNPPETDEDLVFEDDRFDYRLENDPRFLERIESARRNLRAGRSIRLEDVGA